MVTDIDHTPATEISVQLSSSRGFSTAWLAAAYTAGLFGLIFGLTSFMVYVSDLGPFYGGGWASMAFLIGLPLSALTLVLTLLSHRVRSLFGGASLLLGGSGFVLSLIGMIYVFNTMLSLVKH